MPATSARGQSTNSRKSNRDEGHPRHFRLSMKTCTKTRRSKYSNCHRLKQDLMSLWINVSTTRQISNPKISSPNKSNLNKSNLNYKSYSHRTDSLSKKERLKEPDKSRLMRLQTANSILMIWMTTWTRTKSHKSKAASTTPASIQTYSRSSSCSRTAVTQWSTKLISPTTVSVVLRSTHNRRWKVSCGTVNSVVRKSKSPANSQRQLRCALWRTKLLKQIKILKNWFIFVWTTLALWVNRQLERIMRHISKGDRNILFKNLNTTILESACNPCLWPCWTLLTDKLIKFQHRNLTLS
mgnify:CR=1 FL=1